ncbi:putative enoyl-CoA hydratase echA8 [compost metagenome]
MRTSPCDEEITSDTVDPMNFQTLQFEINDGIGTLWLNRPDAHNTVNRQMAKDLRAAGYQIARTHRLRALVLRGRGKVFSAGGDMRMFQENMESIETYMLDVIPDFHEFLMTLRSLAVPTVALLHGAAAGGGLSLALACDFVFAREDTKMAVAYRKLGVSADGGMTHLLTSLLGPRKAMDLMLRKDSFDAREALALGLITDVVSREEFEEKLSGKLADLASNAPAVVREVKALVYGAGHTSYGAQLQAETGSFSRCAATADFREGVSAFLDRRTPNFNSQ